jgi:hypothetical protein
MAMSWVTTVCFIVMHTEHLLLYRDTRWQVVASNTASKQVAEFRNGQPISYRFQALESIAR